MRAGAVLPLLPAGDTLAPYVVRPAVERRPRLDLIAFPRGRWRGTFFRGEKLRSIARRQRWDLTIRGKRKRRYALQAALPFEPCSVMVGDDPVRFRYSGRTRVLRVVFAARRATATVKAC